MWITGQRIIHKDLPVDLAIRHGFQILGALVILAVGVFLARWTGNLTGRWLERQAREPPVRQLVVRIVKILVLIFTLVVAILRGNRHVSKEALASAREAVPRWGHRDPVPPA